MDWVTFEGLVAELRVENPIWFDSEFDRAATAQDIEAMQADLGVKLPESYVRFLTTYGGGDLAFAWVYSVDPESSYFYGHRREPDLPRDLVAFSDDGTGCQYVFPVNEGECEDRVLIWDGETFEVRDSPYVSFLDFLAKVALQQG